LATFLTTPRMSPALAARVEASVRGRPVRPRQRASPNMVVLGRVVGLALIVGLVAWAGLMLRRQQDALDSVRHSLLEQRSAYLAQLTDKQRAAIVQVEVWLTQLAGPYEGDRVVDELRSSTALAEVLARPMVYLRGPLEGFASATGRANLAATSHRDAFVLCLLDPPVDRSEKSLRIRARAALAGKSRAPALANVERWHSALVGLPLLQPAWEERVRNASDTKELGALRQTFLRASMADAVRAAKARVLLVAMDEPKEGNGPTEIDGACAHHVRVALVDLETDALLLRARQLVDPEWISEGSRLQFSSGIIGCELALEVRATVTGIPAPERPGNPAAP